mmetsp:Transcript_94740/g.267842  ORF Transcript_94740/g.267842 Transcript_94740/m.267842 type:complete len:422 (+) Transcript_94740:123-1388(+)
MPAGYEDMLSLAFCDVEHANLVGFHGSPAPDAAEAETRASSPGPAAGVESAREELDGILWWAGGVEFGGADEPELRPAAMETLEQVAGAMKRYPALGLEVCCFTGALEPDLALELARNRACAVKRALQEGGMANTISVVGKGFCDHMGPRVELKPTRMDQEQDDMLEPWMYKAEASRRSGLEAEARAERSRDPRAEPAAAGRPALGPDEGDAESWFDDAMYIVDQLAKALRLTERPTLPAPSLPCATGSPCSEATPQWAFRQPSAEGPSPRDVLGPGLHAVAEPAGPLDGAWTCTATWGLSAFLQENGVALTQRLVAERAPWPSWEFRQDGDTVVFVNNTFLGRITEEIQVGAPAYASVDGFGQELSCRAFWEGGALVIERSAPQGRFREERWLEGGQLHFLLKSLEAGRQTSWGRTFRRK